MIRGSKVIRSFSKVRPNSLRVSTPLTLATDRKIFSVSSLATKAAQKTYKVCKPNQYLVTTCLGMNNVSKSGVCWPSSMIVDVNPTSYMFSKGKVGFELPIGPTFPEYDTAAFNRYCKLLKDMTPEDIDSSIKAIIECKTRDPTACLSVDDMFNGKEKFRNEVNKFKPELAELGVKIYDTKIREMNDFKITSNEASGVVEGHKKCDNDVSITVRDTRIDVTNDNGVFSIPHLILTILYFIVLSFCYVTLMLFGYVISFYVICKIIGLIWYSIILYIRILGKLLWFL